MMPTQQNLFLAAVRGRSGGKPTSRPGLLLGPVLSILACVGLVFAQQDEAVGPVSIQATERTSFVRMEDSAFAAIAVSNTTDTDLAAGRVTIRGMGQERLFDLPVLPGQQQHALEWPVDTSLRPGVYPLEINIQGPGYQAAQSLELVLVARPLPQQMPVVMWGGGGLDRLTEIGFTHKLHYMADYGKIWRAGEPTQADDGETLAQKKRALNQQLARGIGSLVYLYPGRWVARNETLYQAHRRLDPEGQPYNEQNVCASFPALQQYSYNVGASIIRTFGAFPALQGALVHSEIRDGTNLCFHPHDRQAYRLFSGSDIPPLALHKGGVRHHKIADFPRHRLVDDNDEILSYYRWFWKNGDGWNQLHTQIHKGLKSTGRDDLWTFFDPAVRAPSIWGSGGAVDHLSHWTYSYPDPLKIGQATDALFAMAAGRPGQQVMKMTQVIWYRSQTAPQLPADQADHTDWEKAEPEARFITIAPDHLRQAFWTKIARPIRGIMYHGWGSLVETGSDHAYRYTNPQAKEVLQELVETVVRPLGPTLLQVDDRPADVALLESFAAQVFAGRGSSGWGRGWEADAHLVLQWAQLQPKIVYDESVLADGLTGVRVLVLPNADVLTKEVAARIGQFQDQGGLVVADEHVAPAILPDILLPSYRRTGNPQQDKAALQQRAASLRQELDAFYARYADSADPDIVLRARQYGSADYIFAINDKRTYGDYVGQHGLVMEKGVAAHTTVQVARPGGHVYDLLHSRKIDAQQVGGQLHFTADLPAGGGNVYLLTEQAINAVELKAPEQAQRGGQVELQVRVVDNQGQPILSVVPLQIEILDPQGRPAEYSGYYGARDGDLHLLLDIAPNDLQGTWTLRVQERASGKSSQHVLAVR
ncbi:MAG: hypothetical protein GKR89_14540 [Candidatus Latescibacteria bacterium]|nr:hypothetical protein [Candidatus Latescibacterota bacterium]